jgi:hypothetical protein
LVTLLLAQGWLPPCTQASVSDPPCVFFQMNANDDMREEQTDRVVKEFFRDIFDEDGNVGGTTSAVSCNA